MRGCPTRNTRGKSHPLGASQQAGPTVEELKQSLATITLYVGPRTDAVSTGGKCFAGSASTAIRLGVNRGAVRLGTSRNTCPPTRRCSARGTARAENGACEDGEGDGGSRDGHAYHTRSSMEQRTGQHGRVTVHNILLSDPCELGKLQDVD